jgi:hypothetical protein
MKAIPNVLCRCGKALDPKNSARLVRWLVLALLTLYITAAGFAEGDTRAHPVQLNHDARYILEAVAGEMNVTLRTDIPEPEILFESTTPLSRFQNAIADQWGFRPHVFTNAYAVRTNEIYLTDDPGYYGRLRRTLDDSLAHELAHYIQVHYLNADLAEDSLENDAVAVQGWFRATLTTTAGTGRDACRDDAGQTLAGSAASQKIFWSLLQPLRSVFTPLQSASARRVNTTHGASGPDCSTR